VAIEIPEMGRIFYFSIIDVKVKSVAPPHKCLAMQYKSAYLFINPSDYKL